MTPEQILTMAHKKGIILSVQGDLIIYKAPLGTMTPDLIESLRTHKKNIIGLLTDQQPLTKCLGAECVHARYEDEGRSRCLWCGNLEKAVIYLMECPKGNWQKDAKGFPLPKKNLTIIAKGK